MSDQYWERLASAMRRAQELGPANPDEQWPDAQLRDQLMNLRESEASYSAPEVGSRDITIDYSGGAFGVRIYGGEPGEDSRPLLIWCHGGAWVADGLDSPEGDATAREVAIRANAIVVSVDYRPAANGTHYPVPLDDVVAAFLWVHRNAFELGADASRITLGGASAGANLAAGAVLRLRDDGAALPRAVALAYPALHDTNPTPSAELAEKLARMSPSAAMAPHLFQVIVENYLGAPADSGDSYGFPARSRDLAGLPPMYIFNDEFDGLRASGEAFAERLTDAGVTVLLETVPGVAHGHLSRPGLRQSTWSHARLADWVIDPRSVQPATLSVT